MDSLKKELATLTGRRDRIIVKRDGAKSEVGEAESARLALLTESDVDDIKAEMKAQTRVDNARSTLDGFEAAIGALNAQIAATERKLAEELDRTERAAVADKIEASAAAAEKTLTAIAALRASGEAFVPLKALCHDAREFIEAIDSIAHQLERAATAAIADARAQAGQVRAREMRIPNLRPEQPLSLLPAPQATEKVFAVKHLCWTDHAGKLQRGCQYHDANVPPAAAARAIELAAAVPIGSDQARKHRGVHEYKFPDLYRCVALDESAAAEQAQAKINEPERATRIFEPLDRGPGYTATISREALK